MNFECRLVLHHNPPITIPACRGEICPANQLLLFTIHGAQRVVMFSQFYSGPLHEPNEGVSVVSLVLSERHHNAQPGEFLLELCFDDEPERARAVVRMINDICSGRYRARAPPPPPPPLRRSGPPPKAARRYVPPVQESSSDSEEDAGGVDQQNQNVAVEEDPADREEEQRADDEDMAHDNGYVAPASPEPIIRNIVPRRDGGSPPALGREPLVGLLDDSSSGDELMPPLGARNRAGLRARQRGRQRGRRGGRRRQGRRQQQRAARDRTRSRSSSSSSESSTDSSSSDSESRDRHGNHTRRSVIEHCRVRDSVITDSVLRNCQVDNSTVRNSQISGCRINRSDCNHVRLNQ